MPQTLSLTLRPSGAVVAADPAGRIPVEGVLAVEGDPTGDGRMIDVGALRWEGVLPIPILFDRNDGDHDGPTIGAVTDIERRDNGVIWGVGYLSSSEDPETQQLVVRATELLEEGAVGVSLRFDDEDVEVRVKRSLIEEAAVEEASIDAAEEELDEGEERIIVARYSADDVLYVFTDARVRHLAIVDTAAIVDGHIHVTGAVAASAIVGDWAGREPWFHDPAFGEPGTDPRLRYDPDRGVWSCPPTLTDDGRVYGHITPQGICLRGRPDRCVTPPDGNLEGFMRGRAPAAGGLRTGVICVGGGHCGVGVGAEEATRFYDNTGRAVADVRVGKDRYGIWFAGMARPGASPDDLYAFAASDVSGHWEYTRAGRMSLVGLPAVNVGGFPKGYLTYDEFRRGLAASAAASVEDGCGSWQQLSDGVAVSSDIDARLSRIELAIGEMYAAHLRSQET